MTNDSTASVPSALLQEPTRTVGLIVNAPEVFARPDFMDWLNAKDRPIFTWHDRGNPTPGEYSDVVVLVDSGYEGDSSDMPHDVWQAICDLVYREYGGETIPHANAAHVHVRLTNLTE